MPKTKRVKDTAGSVGAPNPPFPANSWHLFLLQVPKFLVDHPENLFHGLGLDSTGAGCGVLRSRCSGSCPRLTPRGTRRGWRSRRLAAASAVAGGRGHLWTVRGKKKKREEGQERRVRRRTGRDAGQNAQRARASASGWGWGRDRARAPRGQEGTASARATRQPSARPGLAPPPVPPLPARAAGSAYRPGAPRLALGAGPRRAGQLPVQRSPQGRASRHRSLPRKGGKREVGAGRPRRVEKGTGNDWGREGGGGT